MGVGGKAHYCGRFVNDTNNMKIDIKILRVTMLIICDHWYGVDDHDQNGNVVCLEVYLMHVVVCLLERLQLAYKSWS